MEPIMGKQETRRSFILKGGVYIGAAVLMNPVPALAAPKKTEETVEVTPTEDLMQEHGVLRRLLLIYDEIGRRLKQGPDFPLQALKDASGLIRRFVEDYHEKDEEEYLFTRFRQSGKMVDLVDVLYQQHQAGRQVTSRLQSLIASSDLQSPQVRAQINEYLDSFTLMYRPHAAREDTVLYPAFRSVIAPKEFEQLGEAFEKKEEKLFGKEGFQKIVGQVADIEKTLGIYELSQFTPKVAPASSGQEPKTPS